MNIIYVLEYANKSIEISKKINNNSILANTYLNIGVYYIHKSNFKESLDALFTAEKLFDSLRDHPGMRITKQLEVERVAKVKANIGSCYQYLQQDELAKNYFSEALHIAKNSGELYSQLVAFRGLGFIYQKEGKLKESKEQILLAYSTSVKLGLKHYISSTLLDLGNLYREIGDIVEAKKNMKMP